MEWRRSIRGVTRLAAIVCRTRAGSWSKAHSISDSSPRLVDKGAHEKQIIDVTLLARGRLVAQLHVNVSGDWRRSGLVSSRHFLLGRTFGSLALFATRLVDRPHRAVRRNLKKGAR